MSDGGLSDTDWWREDNLSRPVRHVLVGEDNYGPRLPQPSKGGRAAPTPGALPGRHLLVDLQDAIALDDATAVERAIRDGAASADAHILAFHLHRFTPFAGLTAAAMLAESHITIHTWPEEGFAAVDIFMCGACDPLACLPALISTFLPGVVTLYGRLRRAIPADQ